MEQKRTAGLAEGQVVEHDDIDVQQKQGQGAGIFAFELVDQFDGGEKGARVGAGDREIFASVELERLRRGELQRHEHPPRRGLFELAAVLPLAPREGSHASIRSAVTQLPQGRMNLLQGTSALATLLRSPPATFSIAPQTDQDW